MDKPLVWLRGEIKSPPLTKDARIEAGVLLRQLQQGVKLSLPHSRSMPRIGPRSMSCVFRMKLQRGV